MRLQLIEGKPTEPVWLYGLAGALMLGGPIGRELYFNHYPARPEAFVVPLIAGAIGAICAIGSRATGGLLGAFIFGGLLFVFADVQFDPEEYTYTAAVLAGCIVLALLLTRHRAAIFAAGLGAFFLSSAIRPGYSSRSRIPVSAAAPTRGPVLVHVVLDEQWGIGGLRAAGDSATADFLTGFYLDRGFEVFEAAYSRYNVTAASLPFAVSLGQSPSFNPSTPTPLGERYLKSMHRTPYFERLRDLGYDIRVYQSTYVDYCNSVDVQVSCDVQQANSIANIGLLGGSWITRAKSTERYFLSTRSHVYAKYRHAPSPWRRAVAGGGVAAMERFTRDIAAGQPKATAYFVHVLLPHGPVQLDAACRALPDPARFSADMDPELRLEAQWRASLGAYGGQVRCTHLMLGRVIDAVDSTVGRDNSIIVVHGDHGSRMHRRKPVRESVDAYTPAELNSAFATLLAVRRPHTAPALHQYPVSIQDAIWELARSGFKGPLLGQWQHELRSNPDSVGKVLVRPLTTADMLWVRRPN